jgi:hypothetical protein
MSSIPFPPSLSWREAGCNVQSITCLRVGSLVVRMTERGILADFSHVPRYTVVLRLLSGHGIGFPGLGAGKYFVHVRA